jgi:hypothetical protein
MGLKRKSPENNVRRVAAIDKNSRYAITNKNGETVQHALGVEPRGSGAGDID